MRNIEKERISATSSAMSSNNFLSITIRDPNGTTMKILDEFFGFAKLLREKFIENHRYLTERAIAQNNPKRGDLSTRYIKAVEQNDSAGQLDVLKAARALGHFQCWRWIEIPAMCVSAQTEVLSEWLTDCQTLKVRYMARIICSLLLLKETRLFNLIGSTLKMTR